MSLQAEDVVHYLKHNPDFLLEHPTLLGSLQLPPQHGGKAVSLHDRQIQVLRDKHKLLEQKLVEMGRAAAENHAIVQKMQTWYRDILREKDLSHLPSTLTRLLGQLFSIPCVELRLWGQLGSGIDATLKVAASEADIQAVTTIEPLYCGSASGVALTPWLDAGHHVKSVVFMPLRVGLAPDAFGVLILGSPDAGRYTQDMGQAFLLSIQESASAALSRLLE